MLSLSKNKEFTYFLTIVEVIHKPCLNPVNF
uniref:Uncharacterized protein n=1 Tax=Anguilla anguilla TaxID=7936 RepID=A0A0E9Y1R1_ANGAN